MTASHSGVLERRALNRATLARQHLLGRSNMTPLQLVEHLAGLQAQTPHTWYTGLWARLEGFDPADVGRLLRERSLVRIALMRSTIHLVTARDAIAFRPLLQPVIDRGTDAAWGKRLQGVDRQALAEATRQVLEEGPLTFAEIGSRLNEVWPQNDPAALAQAARAAVPLVQVPPRGVWGESGPVAHEPLESWVGGRLDTVSDPAALVLRYLAAFGPASVADVQAWSGLTRLGSVLEGLRSRLLTFRDEDGRELFDLEEAPRPEADLPAPPRFLYDFDNLLLSHADRRRVVSDDYRARAFTRQNEAPNALLVDGFTAGTWKVERSRDGAVLNVQPFRRLTANENEAVPAEGARLLDFLAPQALRREVRLLPPK
jgi:hypothetical protein